MLLSVQPADAAPPDSRLGEQRTLNSYFPFTQVGSAEEWQERREELVRRVRVSTGLWPTPTKTPLNPVVHGRVDKGEYTVDRVFFDSIPGHYVTGSLYLPKGAEKLKNVPAVLCPHGHWANGRFYEVADAARRAKDMESGAEKFESGAHSPLQARCVQLARMGCAVFHYDMLNYADSIQMKEHRPWERDEMSGDKPGEWGFSSTKAAAHLQTSFGLQTWNSVRALDFLHTLEFIDKGRIAVTGGSGGGTQTMMLTAIDDRITAAFPAVMVSTSMQGGCTCENGHYLRIGCGNIDIAALTAPRPLGVTAADDWTIELETKGAPDLHKLYEMLGVPDRFTPGFFTQFKHNYNHVSRSLMYGFINRHFELGLEPEQVAEREFDVLSKEQLTVWNDEHPAPDGDKAGDAHERSILEWMTADSQRWLGFTDGKSGKAELEESREIIAGGLSIMIGRRLPDADEVASELLSKEDRGTYLDMETLVKNSTHGEASPARFFYPKDWNQKVVIWVTEDGKSGLANGAGKPRDEVVKLLESGYAVGALDLFMQGEFLDGAEPPKVNRIANDEKKPGRLWLGYSAYTYGYNHPLFSQRVHDLLNVIALARHDQLHPVKEICLVGIEGGGKWVAAARAVAGDAVSRAAVDPGGFRFGNLNSQWDADFLPGVLKYGGLDGMFLCAAPEKLWLATDSKSFDWLPTACEKLGAKGGVVVTGTGEGNEGNAASSVAWLIANP